MTFTTLQYNGVEKPLADWGISSCLREVSNQAHDHVACDWMLPADANDPIPYGSQIILRILRNSVIPIPANGLPPSGLTAFTGGSTFFVGWRVENFRTGSPALEKMELKFAGPWEFFFERLIFQKLWYTWNGLAIGSGGANIADYRSQVILGLSVTAETGTGDTIPGTSATNLMSIRQQVAEIIAYVAAQTNTDYGAPQIQSDALTASVDSVNYDLIDSYPGNFPGGLKLLIPDFIAGAYASSGKTSASANLQSVLRAPLDAVSEMSCAECMRRQLKWVGPLGEAVVWFDYTTTLSGNPCPTLHVGTMDQLANVTLAMVGQLGAPQPGGGGNAGFKIKKRDDLIPGAVALAFRITGTFNGNAYVEVIHDIAATVGGAIVEGIGLLGQLNTLATFTSGSPTPVASGTQMALQAAARDFAAVRCTVDMEGNSNNVARCTIKTSALNTADFGSGGFWQHIFPEFATMATAPSLFSGSSVTATDDSGNALTFSGGGTVITDTNGNTYSYILTDGQVAPWMLAGNAAGGAAANVLQCTLNGKFVITETTVVSSNSFSLKFAPYKEKTARVTLVSIPGGSYQVQTSFTPGEIVPYGLAGYIYGISLIPQFEGSFVIQETEVSDQCPIGVNLNISGGQSAWSTMNACVQQISYDLTAGRTNLSFGPASHLGAKDFVERLRVNRSPIRSIYGSGFNVTNSSSVNGGTQLGNSVAQRGPSPGTENHSLITLPASLSDLAADNSAYLASGSGVGPPGITHDTRTSGQPNYGNIGGLSAPNAATILLAAGSGGALSKCIRLSVADLVGANKQAWFQPMSICVNVGGTPTTKTIYVLCTAPE